MRVKKKSLKELGSLHGRPIDAIEALIALSDEKTFNEDDLFSEETPDMLMDEFHEFDVAKMIEDEINNFSPISRDLRIDDSKIPRAPNFYRWCIGEEFLNSPPYLEQALIGLRFFGEYCVHCSDLEWMKDDGHEANEGLPKLESKVCMLQHGVCPKCGATKVEMLKSKKLNFYNELAINAGQRSGKSAVTTMIASYILHKYLMVGKPTDLLNIRPNEILHGTFLALTLGQAKENLWDPFYGYITESPWFRMYHNFLRYHEERLGEQLFSLKETFVKYRHRNMFWYAATPDKRVLRGRTRIFAAIDELGWFDANRDSKKVKDNAHEVYKAASNSLATARQSEVRLVNMGFPEPLTGFMVNVSSPSSIRDKITELVRQSVGSTKLLGLHKPTWKMNPNLPRESPIIMEEFRKDPIGAARDFGAEPSLSSHPFISNTHAIEGTVREKGGNWVKYRLQISMFGKGKEAKRYRSAEVIQVKPTNKYSVMAIDAGLSNNSFAMAIGSLHDDNTIHVDCLIEVMPLPGIVVSHTLIFEDVIKPMIKKRNVKVLLADRWNSVKLLEDAQRDTDIPIAKQYSLKFTDMYAVKDAIEMGGLFIPKTENKTIKQVLDHNPDEYPKCFEGRPVDHLLLQLATIEQAGKEVVKGSGFTDDLWRATALMYWGLRNPDFAEHLEGESKEGNAAYGMYIHVKKMSSIPGGVKVGGGITIARSSNTMIGMSKSMKRS